MLDREMARQIVNVRELANHLHRHPPTVYRLAKLGELPAFRLGGSWRFRLTDIDRWSQNTSDKATALDHVRPPHGLMVHDSSFSLTSPPPGPRHKLHRQGTLPSTRLF
jgi:excisionase family DNA binding protein